ncbi:MAG: hypothetical protein Q4F85_15780, partial [Prevotella sp.]|nr:hypothetical protein [Prevotella sp.]
VTSFGAPKVTTFSSISQIFVNYYPTFHYVSTTTNSLAEVAELVETLTAHYFWGDTKLFYITN